MWYVLVDLKDARAPILYSVEEGTAFSFRCYEVKMGKKRRMTSTNDDSRNIKRVIITNKIQLTYKVRCRCIVAPHSIFHCIS